MYESLDIASFGLVALSGLLGGAIGFERELADKPAGLRTHIFVAAGSTLLVLLGETALASFQAIGSGDRIQGDPIRVIQAIIVGISFLGAGTIVHHRSKDVEGLTTAASIYLTACIGIAVGLMRIPLAVETTIFAIAVLLSARWVEGQLLGKPSRSDVRDSDQIDE